VIKSKNLLGVAVAEDGLGDCSCDRTVWWPENVCSIYKGVNRDNNIKDCYSPEGNHPPHMVLMLFSYQIFFEAPAAGHHGRITAGECSEFWAR